MTAASAQKSTRKRRAERLDDPAYEKLRTPGARRALVLALTALLLAEGTAFVLAEFLGPGLYISTLMVVLVAFVIGLGMLKLSTRGVEELPAAALDERQRQIRGDVYARAYRIGQVLVTLEAAAALAAWIFDVWPLSNGILLAALVLPIHLAIVLPTMVAAWTHDA